MTTGRINQVTLVKKELQNPPVAMTFRLALLFFLHRCSKENSGSGSVICLIDWDRKIRAIASQFTAFAEIQNSCTSRFLDTILLPAFFFSWAHTLKSKLFKAGPLVEVPTE